MSDETNDAQDSAPDAEHPERAAPARRPRRDGSKTAAKLEARIARRAERLALDQLRHQELLDNQESRKARSLSRRWFVLGRALDAALRADPSLEPIVRAALLPHLQRPDERALVGWTRGDGA